MNREVNSAFISLQEILTPLLETLNSKIDQQCQQISELSARLVSLEAKPIVNSNEEVVMESPQVVPQRGTFEQGSKKVKLMQNLVNEIRICDGKNANELISFIIEVDKIHKLAFIPENEFLIMIMTRVTGFLSFWWQTKMSMPIGWENVKISILNEILSPVHVEVLKNELCLRFQRPNETLLEFAHSVDAVARALNLNWSEEQLIQTVMSKISSKIYYYLRTSPSDIKSLVQLTTISSEIEGAILRDQCENNASNTTGYRRSFGAGARPTQYTSTDAQRNMAVLPRVR